MGNEEKIVVRSLNKPTKQNTDELIVWFLKSFGLAESAEDFEPSLLKEIFNASISGTGVTSKELTADLETPRTTVIYHLNRFIGSGLIVRKGTRYFLRSEDMESTIEELQSDMFREFNRMLEFAEELDKMMISGGNDRGKEKRKAARSQK